MYKTKCFIKRTDSGWYATSVSTSLENLQRLVDGYIETVTFPDLDVAVVCNEEGRLRGLPYCCTIGDVELVGDVVVFGFDGDEFTDVPHSLKEWKQLIEGGCS